MSEISEDKEPVSGGLASLRARARPAVAPAKRQREWHRKTGARESKRMRESTTRERVSDLTGKVAIVTGGTGDIGLGVARGLLQAGASVMLAGRDRAKGARAVEKLGDRAAFMMADVSREDSCKALVSAAVSRFATPNILVNNAGVAILKLPEEFAEAEWRAMLDVNLTAAFLMSRQVFPNFVEAGGGKIINIAHLHVLMADPNSVTVAASKAGLIQLTRGLATAWASHNIQINAILPGWIETDAWPLATALRQGLAHDEGKVRTPAGRWGRPDDLAGMVVLLASSASSFVTGAVIPVDGGYSIRT